MSLDLNIPWRRFYNRCISSFQIGNTALYDFKLKNVNRFCFNPFLMSECDVQIKLAVEIENYIAQENLPYTVNAEIKIYKIRERADLSIHKLTDDFLYKTANAHLESLTAVVEIKYANASHPEYDFKKGSIDRDLEKLSLLSAEVARYFVFIDEADRLSQERATKLFHDCRERKITLWSNNSVMRALSLSE